MITCYFGVPGVGKTTLLTKFARKELKRIRKGKSKYDAVYTNFYCKGANRICFDDLKDYKVYNALVLFDEMTLDADNRKFKEFTDEHRDYFILHRHIGNDIIYATQMYDKVDSKIRSLTQELWYMSKTVVPIFRNFTSAKRIYRNININEHTSELTMGYRFCNIIESFFASNYKLTFRPCWYKYFDSFEEGVLENRPVLPSVPWQEEVEVNGILMFLNNLEYKVRTKFLSKEKRNIGDHEMVENMPDLNLTNNNPQ